MIIAPTCYGQTSMACPSTASHINNYKKQPCQCTNPNWADSTLAGLFFNFFDFLFIILLTYVCIRFNI